MMIRFTIRYAEDMFRNITKVNISVLISKHINPIESIGSIIECFFVDTCWELGKVGYC